MTVSDTVGQQDSPAGTPADPANADAAQTPEGDLSSDHDQDQGDNGEGGKDREVAKLRKRAQKAERERDEARAQVTALQPSIVDNIVSAAGYSPKILSRTDKQLADFLNDDGWTVDAAKVTQAVTEAATELNIARKPHPPVPNPQQGRGTGQPRGESSWSKTLKG